MVVTVSVVLGTGTIGTAIFGLVCTITVAAVAAPLLTQPIVTRAVRRGRGTKERPWVGGLGTAMNLPHSTVDDSALMRGRPLIVCLN